jgi:hypothetical protein
MKKAKNEPKKYKLSTGYEFTANPVNSMLIYDAQEQFRFPEVPKIQIRQGGQTMWVDNSSDPTYTERFAAVERQRNMAALSTIIQNGIRLASPLPDTSGWLRKVRRLVDLSLYEDDKGEITGEDLEYLFLRYVAISSAEDYQLIFNSATLTEERVQEEMAAFPGDAEGE